MFSLLMCSCARRSSRSRRRELPAASARSRRRHLVRRPCRQRRRSRCPRRRRLRPGCRRRRRRRRLRPRCRRGVLSGRLDGLVRLSRSSCMSSLRSSGCAIPYPIATENVRCRGCAARRRVSRCSDARLAMGDPRSLAEDLDAAARRRDPAVPWRAVALLGVAVAAVVVVIVVVVAPAFDRSKEPGGRERATPRGGVQARGDRPAALRPAPAQRPRPARGGPVPAGRRAGRRPSCAPRAASVMRDARARVASGEFERPVRSVRCRPRGRLAPPRIRLSCFAVTTQTRAGPVGQPFIVARLAARRALRLVSSQPAARRGRRRGRHVRPASHRLHR